MIERLSIVSASESVCVRLCYIVCLSANVFSILLCERATHCNPSPESLFCQAGP